MCILKIIFTISSDLNVIKINTLDCWRYIIEGEISSSVHCQMMSVKWQHSEEKHACKSRLILQHQ